MRTDLSVAARSALGVLILASCFSLTDCNDDSGLDNYTYSRAVVRGSVRQENNAPVAGATVQVFAEFRSTCQGTTLPYGELSTTTTDASGNYVSRPTIGPISEKTGCVTVRIKPSDALALRDTISEGVLVTMRADQPGAVLDTARIDLVLKEK